MFQCKISLTSANIQSLHVIWSYIYRLPNFNSDVYLWAVLYLYIHIYTCDRLK